MSQHKNRLTCVHITSHVEMVLLQISYLLATSEINKSSSKALALLDRKTIKPYNFVLVNKSMITANLALLGAPSSRELLGSMLAFTGPGR